VNKIEVMFVCVRLSFCQAKMFEFENFQVELTFRILNDRPTLVKIEDCGLQHVD
jgi:hypothetical protein